MRDNRILTFRFPPCPVFPHVYDGWGGLPRFEHRVRCNPRILWGYGLQVHVSPLSICFLILGGDADHQPRYVQLFASWAGCVLTRGRLRFLSFMLWKENEYHILLLPEPYPTVLTTPDCCAAAVLQVQHSASLPDGRYQLEGEKTWRRRRGQVERAL